MFLKSLGCADLISIDNTGVGGHSDSCKNASARGGRASGVYGRGRRGQHAEVIWQQTRLPANTGVTIWELPRDRQTFSFGEKFEGALGYVMIANAGVRVRLLYIVIPSS